MHQLKTLIEYTLKQLILLFFSSKDMSCLFTEPLFSLHRSSPDIILCGVLMQSRMHSASLLKIAVHEEKCDWQVDWILPCIHCNNVILLIKQFAEHAQGRLCYSLIWCINFVQTFCPTTFKIIVKHGPMPNNCLLFAAQL